MRNKISIYTISMLLLAVAFAGAQEFEITDMDSFMEKVLDNQDRTWDRMYNYLFREVETIKVTDEADLIPFEGMEYVFDYYVREGYLVRSPHSKDGRLVSEEEVEKAEQRSIKSQKKRGNKDSGNGGQFFSRDDFFGQKIEPANCFFAGWETIGDYKVAVIEYYPPIKVTKEDIAKPFDDDDKIEVFIEKTFYVTMYVLPESHQIIRMELNNAGMDFLPGRAAVRVDKIQARMQMLKLADGNWVPDEILTSVSLMSGNGKVAVSLGQKYSEYSKSKVTVQFRVAPQKGDQKWQIEK
jgi:hypothetical protein